GSRAERGTPSGLRVHGDTPHTSKVLWTETAKALCRTCGTASACETQISSRQVTCKLTCGTRRLIDGSSWGDERRKCREGEAHQLERDVEPLEGEPHEEHHCR